MISAVPADADSILIDVTIRAKVSEWKLLRQLITEQRDKNNPIIVPNLAGTSEPFWSLIHRLGDVIAAVEKQHTNYPS